MGSLQKTEVEVSCKLKKKKKNNKEMHFLHGHGRTVYKVSEGNESRSHSRSPSEKSCNLSSRCLSLDMCKQYGVGSYKELCLKVSLTIIPKPLIPVSSLNASSKLEQNPLDTCVEKFSSLEVSLVDKVSTMKPLNPLAREYHRVGDNGMKPLNPLAREYHRLSCKQESQSMPSFFETLGNRNSSNISITDPITFSNISGNSNLLNILNYFPHKPPVFCSKKKLLILDINGILADIVYPPPKGYKADTKIAGRAVFTRPYCFEFLNFCLERFNVAIWSSRSRKIIDRLLNYLMGDMKDKLIFCWDLSHCTASNFRTLENRHKTLVFKELRKVWESYDADLPWEKGFFDESNTFLLDDTPYKALLNPAHTAVFPYSYGYKDIADNAIGPQGNIRAYLEEIAEADNVQRYIEKHPFGQNAISERSLTWEFYDKVIKDQTATATPTAVPANAGG